MIKENKLLKDFKLPSTNGKYYHLKKDLKQNLIIYIYPKIILQDAQVNLLTLQKIIKFFRNLKLILLGFQKIVLKVTIVLKENINFHLSFCLMKKLN